MNIRFSPITKTGIKMASKSIYLEDMSCIMNGPDIVFLFDDKQFKNKWREPVIVTSYQIFLDDILVVNEKLLPNEIELEPGHSITFKDLTMEFQLSPKQVE